MSKRISTFFKSILAIISLDSCGDITTTKNFKNGQKNLVVFSDYGAKTDVVIENITENQINKIMDQIDWNNYHMVYLERNKNEMIGVLGLMKDDGTTPAGFTSTWDENGKMLVIKVNPTTVNQMKNILISYLNDDKELKNNYE